MKRIALFSSVVLLSACSMHQKDPAPDLSAIETRGQLSYSLANGDYECNHGQRLSMRRNAHNEGHIHLDWNGGEYEMKRDPSYSGLPRYEDDHNTLVWIELPWKGVLLDAQTHKPLANECTTS